MKGDVALLTKHSATLDIQFELYCDSISAPHSGLVLRVPHYYAQQCKQTCPEEMGLVDSDIDLSVQICYHD